MMGTSATLAGLAYTGQLEVWHLALASFLNGVGWATDNPVRRVMLGEVVGTEAMGTAMSIDVGANNASRMVGPTLGGLLLGEVGIAGVFALSVLLYLTALWSAFGVRYRNRQQVTGSGTVLTRMMEGLRLVRRTPSLVGTLVITVIFNVFAWPFTSLVPVVGHDRLHLGAKGIGILASLDGVGAFFGAVLIALFVRPRFYACTYVGGIAAYCAMLTLFAFAPDAQLAGLALLATGFGGAGFSIMQATLIYLAAPPEMRSRMLGVLSVCIGTGPIGFIHVGLMADLIGAQWAIAASGLEGLAALGLTWRWWRRIQITSIGQA